MSAPPDFPTSDDRSYTLRQILDDQADDAAWIPDMMAGRTIDDVGADARGAPEGTDLLGDAPHAARRAHVGDLGHRRTRRRGVAGMGVFGPAVDVPDDAPVHDRLLGLTGRQP